MKINVEIRAAEGGKDSKLLVEDMAAVYQKAAKINNYQFGTVHWREGFVVLWIAGKGCKKFFEQEQGGHRFHRVPPTENKGRVHTSIITVAVMEVSSHKDIEIHDSELHVDTMRGSGKGGQHRNVTDSCVVMTHVATGIQVRRDGRDQHKNRRDAKAEITHLVNRFYQTGVKEEVDQKRKGQVGSGQRGDKRRTYRVNFGYVVDHITGKQAKWKDVSRGKLGGLHA